MSAWKHRLNRTLAWGMAGAAAAYIALFLIDRSARLLGVSVSGLRMNLAQICFLAFIVLVPLWFLTRLLGWSKAPAGRLSRMAWQGAGTGWALVWSGFGLAGCVFAVLIAIRLFTARSYLVDAVLGAGLGLFAGLVGIQALRIGLNLNRDPQRAGHIARATSRGLKNLAIASVALGPIVSIVWTVGTAIGLGKDWGWAVLVSPITLAYPVMAGLGVAAVLGIVALAFAYTGKRY